MFDDETWQRVPFHFWSVVFFVFGTMVGSFLNVVIHRLPLDQSIVSPPSHCPHCKYSIPWYLNVPLVTWLWLRGKCANCKAPISVRYFLVELLTGVMFLGSWLAFGADHPGVAVIYSGLFAGFIAATFIDFEHQIIPDEITIGGIVVGFLLSAVVPALHAHETARAALESSFFGIVAGGGIIYAISRIGKLLFGRQRLELAPGTMITFTEETLKLPEEEIPLAEIFYRPSDYIEIQASAVQLEDRTFENVRVRLYPDRLEIAEEVLDPKPIKHMEITANSLVLPREAMGFGDVKFMAAIGAFIGWQGVVFSLMASSILGSMVGITWKIWAALRKAPYTGRLAYGPYIAMAAVVYVFWGRRIVSHFFGW